MTSPTEQMLKAIRTRLDAADMKQYARHPDYWEMPECELSAHAPEDLAKLIQIVELLRGNLEAISIYGVEGDEKQAAEALAKADAIAKGDET